MSGAKIIEGLRDAVAGNFTTVTIEGQRWVRDSGWQSMESAPKDGTEVLLFTHQEVDDFCDEAFDAIQIGYWDEGNYVSDPMWSCEAGWFLQKIGTPLAWMPLPAPPAEGRAP
jgi:hypothetical protein